MMFGLQAWCHQSTSTSRAFSRTALPPRQAWSKGQLQHTGVFSLAKRQIHQSLAHLVCQYSAKNVFKFLL